MSHFFEHSHPLVRLHHGGAEASPVVVAFTRQDIGHVDVDIVMKNIEETLLPTALHHLDIVSFFPYLIYVSHKTCNKEADSDFGNRVMVMNTRE